MVTKVEPTKTGTFGDFKALTIAVARGERAVDPNEPRIWMDARGSKPGTETANSCA
jgi:hypothetical protein